MAENFQSFAQNELILSRIFPCQLLKWKVSVEQKVSKGSILAVYKEIKAESCNESEIVVLPKLKSHVGGLVKRLLVGEGERVRPGQAVILLDVCEHKTVMKEMCAECGADLRQEPGIPGNLKEPVSASVALVHNIPELRVSQKEAEILARKDKETLLRNEKLVLLVDLDQTLIHTTTENVPPDMKDVYHFQLYGQHCWYHAKFRPGWQKFLEDISKLFELHIFTMGSRMYAHTIARMLDPSGVLFSERIRSRDESFDMFSKYRDLRALFPCDDSMVCIIDDREDIWDCAPNLVTVKPYRFFTGTGDINAPPGSEQTFTHAPAIPLHENAVEVKDITDGKGENVSEDEEVEKVDEDSEHQDTKDSSAVSEKPESNGSSEGVQEINHNEKITASEESNERKEGEEECNGEIMREKGEGVNVEVHEMQANDYVDNSPKLEHEDANTQVSEKPNENEATYDNYIEDHDDYLLYLEEILRRIYESFYEAVARNKQAEGKATDSPDLRCIVPELRRNVLKGANVVFTGVIARNCRPEESQAWKIAKQFGANVSQDILTQKNTSERGKRTTHVIAARPGTEKACRATRLPNVQLVSPNWLWTCAERWEWVDERLFPVDEYHEYKTRLSGTPGSSTRGTPKRPTEGEANSEKNNATSTDDTTEDFADHITEENLRIVLNPFLSFSSGEMEAMDKEVEDLMKSSDDEDGSEQEEQVLGNVSSSSNSTENGDAEKKSFSKMEEDCPDGSALDVSEGKAINFLTIKQNRTSHEDSGTPSKRRKLDFMADDNSGGDDEGEGVDDEGEGVDDEGEGGDDEGEGGGEEGEFSSEGGSSGSNSGDEDGNDMAAMLEAALYPS